MKYAYWSLAVIAVIFAIDLAWAHYLDWRKARKRAAEMRKYGMLAGAFKPVSRDWWQA
jgi:hypothetical protein